MSDGPDLISLLYRADWTRLSLAAEVSASWDRDLHRSRFEPGAPWGGPGAPWGGPDAPWGGPRGETWEEGTPPRRFFGAPRRPPWAGREWEMATDLLGTEADLSALLVAPGRRYRQQGVGYLTGCDGSRSWHAAEGDGGWTVEATGGPEPPVASLLRPSWLLTGFTLEPGEPVTASGRQALRLAATPGHGIRGRTSAGPRALDRVEVVVDAELGILLRHEGILDGRTLSVTELTDVRVSPAPGDDAWCQPPGGWDSVDDDVPQITPDGPGWEVTKLAAGLAAGGLGALIRSSRFRPFEQATQEEPEAEMPVDEGPAPADDPAADASPVGASPVGASPVGDEMLHLLHAGLDRWAPGIVATLHQWHDIAAMLSQVPDGARRTGFGGLGFLIDAASERMATLHMVSLVRLGAPGQYRIEPVTSPGQRRPETLICDGERRWRIGEDEVATGPAGPPPGEIANLFDASWLLEHRLAGGAETVTGGRRGYQLDVAFAGPWGGMFFADEVVVDAELGILLRSTSHAGSKPVSRYELRDVAVGEPGDFRADIPPGMRVVEEPDDEPSGPVNIPAKVASIIARQAAKEARSAVRSVLGAIRGEDTR